MGRNKRNFTERIMYLAMSAALIAGSWVYIDRSTYPVTEPYQFPVTTDSPEWAELAEAGLARNACRMPAGLAEQMTSEALLETAKCLLQRKKVRQTVLVSYLSSGAQRLKERLVELFQPTRREGGPLIILLALLAVLGIYIV